MEYSEELGRRIHTESEVLSALNTMDDCANAINERLTEVPSEWNIEAIKRHLEHITLLMEHEQINQATYDFTKIQGAITDAEAYISNNT